LVDASGADTKWQKVTLERANGFCGITKPRQITSCQYPSPAKMAKLQAWGEAPGWHAETETKG
jgi:hypothetical protein